MARLRERLLLYFLFCPVCLLAQTPRKQIVYFDARNQKLPSSKGAAYAVETNFIDSLRAFEKWYSAPQKIKEIASFSNIKRRLRDGETIVYNADDSIKRRTIYRDGVVQENSSYYANRKLRSFYLFEKEKVTAQKCFADDGTPINCDTLAHRTKCPAVIPVCSVKSGVHYPIKALKAGAEGQVKVQFMVNRLGKLIDVWILESPSPLLNQESMAAIRRMKYYCNQYIDCEPVDTLFTVPITFHIE